MLRYNPFLGTSVIIMPPREFLFINLSNPLYISCSQIHENFFSVIKTLILALGHADPCLDMKKYANGLKPVFNNRSTNMLIEPHINADPGIKTNLDTVSKTVEHQVLIQNGSTNSPNYSAPLNIIDRSHLYISKIHNHLNDTKGTEDPYLSKFNKSNGGSVDKMTCRILLLFSQDGIDYASQAVALAKTVIHEVGK